MAPVSITTSDLWNLNASPRNVSALAGDYRTLANAVDKARDKGRGAKNDVWAEQGWTGKTATSYGAHADSLITTLSDADGHITSMRTALEDAADVLKYNQGLLDNEFDKLSGIAVTRSGDMLTFQAKNDNEAKKVTDAIDAATEIRARVDGKLNAVGKKLNSAQAGLKEIAHRWRPNHLRMLNLNVGQGAGNSWRNKAGTDRGDIPALADLIIKNKVDAATLQEMFIYDAQYLESELQKKTGETWKVHFGTASNKFYASDGVLPVSSSEAFGNAVVVREGDGVTSTHTDTVKIDEPGDKVQVRGPNGPTVPDGEGRSATRVRLNYGP